MAYAILTEEDISLSMRDRDGHGKLSSNEFKNRMRKKSGEGEDSIGCKN
jgi:hypothetical protein